MVRQFKSSKQGAADSSNVQLASDLTSHSSEVDTSDLLAQTGGKDFMVKDGQDELSFKLLPNNFGDQLQSVNVLSHQQVGQDTDQVQVTVSFVVNRQQQLHKEAILAQLSAEAPRAPRRHHKKTRSEDVVDEAFSEIQIQDMAQERYTDQKVKEVVSKQQKALSENSVIDEHEKAVEQKPVAVAAKNETAPAVVADAAATRTLSEAEQEANNLAESLQKHEMNIEQLMRKEDRRQFTESMLHENDQEESRDPHSHYGGAELPLLEGMADVNLNSGTGINSETVAKI